jgi:hypothetical protein
MDQQSVMYIRELETDQLRALAPDMPVVPMGTYYCAFTEFGILQCVADNLPQAQTFVVQHGSVLATVH